MATIKNAKNTPLNFAPAGTVPDVSGAFRDWFQPMAFTQIVKSVVGFEAVETPTVTHFDGFITPFTERQLMLKPEGQRAWTWFELFADPVLRLQVDDVVTYLGVATRVMGLKDYSLFGYMNYHLVQDWTGAGP